MCMYFHLLYKPEKDTLVLQYIGSNDFTIEICYSTNILVSYKRYTFKSNITYTTKSENRVNQVCTHMKNVTNQNNSNRITRNQLLLLLKHLVFKRTEIYQFYWTKIKVRNTYVANKYMYELQLSVYMYTKIFKDWVNNKNLSVKQISSIRNTWDKCKDTLLTLYFRTQALHFFRMFLPLQIL